MSDRRFALVAGGGTAGHLQPALAVAEALVAGGRPRTSIEFVGSRRGQDRVVLADRGFPFTLLPGRGVVRSLRPADLARNVAALAGIVWGVVLAVGIVLRARPSVVVAVGGYASVPASLAAVVTGVPLVLVNVDAVPGAANRLLGRFARASAVGWEGTPLPRAVVTGTPVRPEIAAVGRGPADRAAAREQLGLPTGRTTVAAFGGSLGARRINTAVSDLAVRWKDRDDLAVYHVIGRRDWDEAAEAGRHHSDDDGLCYRRVPYDERMALVYSAADVVVSRAGAMTVAELALAGVPAVLVPLPGAPGDHQTANARVLERAGAARLRPDASCDGPALAADLDRLTADRPALEAMGRAARSLGRPDAADAAARLVEEHARRGGRR